MTMLTTIKLFSLLILVAGVHGALIPPKPLSEGVSIQQNSFYATFKAQAGSDELLKEMDAFRQSMNALNISWKERNTFTKYISAMSIDLDAQHIATVATLPMVSDVFPMVNQMLPRKIMENTKNPELKFSHSITGVETVHSKLGLDGEGVRVGVIDSGIDYMHPALGGCFGEGCRVAYGYDFVGDAYTGKNEPQPGGMPRDHCNGHGTHVAGIIGAQAQNITGVAPKVTMGAYRVFGCKGSTANDIILKAMERAADDGMQVINMSLGGGSSWSEYPDAALADVLAKRGVVVVAAMGNEGDLGLWQASSPGLTSTGFGVASFDNTRYLAYGLTVDGSSVSMDYAESKDRTIDLAGVGLVHVVDKDGNVQGCSAIEDEALKQQIKGKVALVERGSCTFAEKALFAQNAEAVGLLVYNNVFGAIKPGVDNEAVKIPVAGMTRENGRRLIDLLKENAGLTVTFEKQQKVYDNPSAGKISSFSSWGPGPELDVKPDIGAPGGLIYSTYPLDMGAYATLSGTSMATPYVAGSVALYMQHRLKNQLSVTPAEIRDVFKITAKPGMQVQSTLLAPVSRQGAGMIQVDAAISASVVASPAHIALNSTDVTGTQLTRFITVSNKSNRTTLFNLKHQPAASVNPFEGSGSDISKSPVLSDKYATVDFEPKTVTLRPGEQKKVMVHIIPPRDLLRSERWLYSGFIVLEPKRTVRDMVDRYTQHEPILSIPYSGMKGNYRKMNPLGDITGPEAEYPKLLDLKTRMPVDAKSVFSLTLIDFPVIQFRLLMPTRLVQVRLVDADSGKELGVIAGGDNAYAGRNDSTKENFSLLMPFLGNYSPVRRGAVDSKAMLKVGQKGRFLFKVMALRPYGNPSNDADFQTWKSPVITIDRTAIPASEPVEDDESSPNGKVDSVEQNQFMERFFVQPGTVPSAESQKPRASDKSVLPAPANLFIPVAGI